MRTRSKLLIAAIGAIALLGMVVSTASATHIEIVNWERGFRIVWSPLTLTAGGREARCPVTVEGSFETHTFAKRAGTRIARITEAAIGTCTRNSATVLRETLPWEVTYNSFGGTLPNIESIKFNILGSSIQTNLEGIACLMTLSSAQPGRGIARASAGTIVGFKMEEGAEIETSGGFFCGLSKARFFGEASSITVRGGAEAMSVRLI